MAKQHRRHTKYNGGEYLVISGEEPYFDAAVKVRASFESTCPDGYHIWSSSCQRSDRGRRATYEVWYRKTEKGRGR